MKNRIRQILLEEGLTSGAFADEIGVQRSSISHILNGRNNPSLDFVIKVVRHFSNLSLEWLLLGEGEMYMDGNNIGEHKRISAPTIFSEIMEDNTGKISDIIDEQPEKEAVNIIEKKSDIDQIIIFYSDSSFYVYKPKK